MLELFEKVWKHEPGIDEIQLSKINAWLSNNHFPVCELPAPYIELLKESNGGDFTIGNREYQLFSADEAMQTYEIYHFSYYMPFAFPFAMDGNGSFYLFNLRDKDNCVYTVSSGDLDWEECHKIADNLAICFM